MAGEREAVESREDREDERELLNGFLDWYRSVAERKVLGLSETDARRRMTASGLSPLGILRHLALVERGWFRDVLAGEDVELPAEGDDNSADFVLEGGDTVESIVDLYRAETAESRKVTAAAPSLDSLSSRPVPWYGFVSLRWVLVHMLEETARHAGHLDLMREEIDGQVGD